MIDCTHCTIFENLNIVKTSLPNINKSIALFFKTDRDFIGKVTFSIATVHGLGRSNSLIVMIRPFPLVSPPPPLMTNAMRGEEAGLICINSHQQSHNHNENPSRNRPNHQLTKEEEKVERKKTESNISRFSVTADLSVARREKSGEEWGISSHDYEV